MLSHAVFKPIKTSHYKFYNFLLHKHSSADTWIRLPDIQNNYKSNLHTILLCDINTFQGNRNSLHCTHPGSLIRDSSPRGVFPRSSEQPKCPQPQTHCHNMNFQTALSYTNTDVRHISWTCLALKSPFNPCVSTTQYDSSTMHHSRLSVYRQVTLIFHPLGNRRMNIFQFVSSRFRNVKRATLVPR